MKVRFNCDSGANIKSCRSEVLDTKDDLGIEDEEWYELTDDQKWEYCNDWAQDKLEIYYEEL